ncbi:MAG: choice-of-anchor I family protein [Oscillospiraceae bacterium]|nr:choice-of-anchor I family protein [Oscillospiraceae bacterium]
MKRLTSFLLVIVLLLSMAPAVYAGNGGDGTTVINSDTTWSYWDQETDPVVNSELYQQYPVRILWAYGLFLQDTNWKWDAGPFGAKNGAIADLGGGCRPKTLLNQYKENGDDIEACFFVTTFSVTAGQLAQTRQILGSLYYDDSAVVYLNGGKVAAFDEPEGGFSQNMEYGGSNASAPKLGEFALTDPSALKEGTNVLAVEIHQGRASSSDIYFDFQALTLSAEEPDYSGLALAQDTIALSVGADETEMNFTWYASAAEAGTITYAPASDLADGRMPENAATATAVATAANRGGWYSNQLTLTGLERGTTYAYQLTNTRDGETVTSAIGTFTTGDGETTRFLFVGDPQLGSSGNLSSDTSGWDATLTKAAEMFPDATFLLSAGDQVDAAASEEQYQSYLNRTVLAGLPQATTIGNHDSGSNSYGQHFNVANESDTLGTTSAGGDNWFVYNSVLFMDLNSNDLSVAEHKAFMEQAIAANPDVSWKIVVFHHSIYSVASHAMDSDILQRRNDLAPVFRELDIDVVLMGHDHVYTRSYMMDGLTPMTDAAIYDDADYSSITDPIGILYVTANSASGSKYYNISGQYEYAAVQNQEKVPNVSYVEMDDSHFTITTCRTSDMSVVDTFTIYRSTYTPVVTGDTRVNGYYDATGSLQLELAGRYNSGAMNADGGSLEIVEYNPVNGFAYAVSGVKGKLIAVDLNSKLDGDTVVALTGTEYDVKSLVEGFAYGDMTSVAISPDGSKLAVAIQAEGYADKGVVALFACNADGSLILLATAAVGVQPDMVTFADNAAILTADEGEPREGTSGTDPKGSVTIVTIGADDVLTANTVYFDSFDAQRDVLTAAGVLVQKNTNPSTDFEPEYIAVSGNTAYISLQEANAIAVLDIASGEFTGVYPLGFQDYSVVKADLQKNDTIALSSYENVYGIKMPDGIAVTTIGGKTYLLTANEGDSRADWDGLDNEYESKTSPTGGVTLDSKVVWFNASLWDGLDQSKAYVFGGRSFSIYEVTDAGLNLVYDSGSGFEEITAEQLPAYFNASNDKTSLDNRSGKKGPEPESVVTGMVDGRTYAFIALERISGVMVYDITDPANAEFVNYINSREFDTAIQGDVSPEGLCFVPAGASRTGNALLLAACEVSGTLAVYELTTPAAPDVPTVPATPAAPADSEQRKGLPFTDVQESGWFYDAVAYVYGNGLMNGMTDTAFAPGVTMTRGMLVIILYRMAGSPAVSGAAGFGDVPAGAYYADAVAWAAANGIVTGYDAATFAPDAPITREQLVAILYRCAGASGDNAALDGFTDAASVSGYASGAMAWAVDAGLITGMGDGTLAPQGSATRAQTAVILMRFAKTAGK